MSRAVRRSIRTLPGALLALPILTAVACECALVSLVDVAISAANAGDRPPRT